MSRRIGIAAAIWAVGILLSRLIGLVREAVFGRIVGGGTGADLYLAAFTLPDFLNYLLAAGALSIVFIPIFGGYLDRGEDAQGWRAFSVISTFVGLILVVVTAAAWFAVPWFDAWWFSGFDAETREQLDALTRLLLPAQIFHVLGGLMSAALQARDRHALPAMAPLLYTVAIIVGGLIGGAEAGPWGFAWGVLVGSVIGPFGLPLIGCVRMGLRYRPVLAWTDDLKRYLWQSLPIMLAFSIIMVDDWLLKGVGATMGEGTVATVLYAKQIMKVPMGVFGLALGAAAFPTLTRLVHEDRRADAYETLSRSLRQMLVLALGAQVALSVAGAEIAQVIYGDRLLPGQHQAIGVAIGLLSLGLWAWSSHAVLARGFYALGKTWVPSVLGTVVVFVAWPLYGWLGSLFGTAGLAMASTIAVSVYVAALAIALRRTYREGADHFAAFAVRIVPAVLIGLSCGYGLHFGLSEALPGGLAAPIDGLLLGGPAESFAGEAGALVQGAVVSIVALAAYVFMVAVLRVPGFAEVVALVRRRLPG